jgi:hypothetical protein
MRSILTEVPTTVRSLIDTDGITIVTTPPTYKILPSLQLQYHHMVIFTIANIANHNQLSTYISQVIGNHPTSNGLSIAKHIFDPRPTIGFKIYLWTSSGSNQLL